MKKIVITQTILLDIIFAYQYHTHYQCDQKIYIEHLVDYLNTVRGYKRSGKKIVNALIKNGVLHYDWSEKYVYTNLLIDGDIKFFPMSEDQKKENEADRLRFGKSSTELIYEVGDKVNYILAGEICFSGTIIKAERTRLFKPYTIRCDNGKIAYSHQEYLQKI